MNFVHEEGKAAEAQRLAESEPLNPHAKARSEAAAQSAAIERRTQNAAKAVAWLNGLGVKILDVKVTHLAAVVRVAFTPCIARLFAGDCAWREQRQVGDTRVLTWFALRYAARIEWEERQPCARS